MNTSSKAVLYARVSSKEQEQEGFSIPAQLRLLKDYAQKHGFEIVQEFVDVETAKQAGREHFGEMVGYLKENPSVQILLVEKTDRLYRNFRDYVTLDDLIHEGLAIHLVKEGEVLSKDSRSHQKFIHGIKVLMAKNYIDNLSEEVKKGMAEKAARGDYPSTAPIGYRNNRETKLLEADLDKARIIREMFRRYATVNYSISQVRDFAQAEGLYPKSGRKIARSSVERILKNPFYYGAFQWKGTVYPKGNHEPIISKELFDTVQEAFDRHNRPKGRKLGLPFASLLTCGRCGCSITAEIHKGRYVYYRCTGFKGKCGQPYVRQEVLAEKLAEVVKAVQIDEELVILVREALHKSHEDEKAYHDGQISSLQARYSQLQHRIDQMYVDKLDGRVAEDFWRQKSEEWRQEQGQLQDRIAKHQQANTAYLKEGVKILEQTQRAVALYVKQTPEEQRRLLNLLLLNCTLVDVTLSPTYREPFNLLVKWLPKQDWCPQRDSNPCYHLERVVS